MVKKIIIANWKMNPPTLKEAKRLFDKVKKGIRGVKNTEVIICPPFLYLSELKAKSYKLKAQLGAQDVFWQTGGPFTGEVSPEMLKEYGVTHVIIGHSERKKWLGETDEMINKKVKAALKYGLIPVLCVGEREREVQGEIPHIVEEQVRAALKGIRKGDFKNGIIAYEPVWAIGTGKAETPDNATRAALYIRKIVKSVLGSNTAEKIRVIYGGSVNAQNAALFIAKDIRGMEGMLVGGASLKAAEFIQIVKNAAEADSPR